jgi:hypothetical protein
MKIKNFKSFLNEAKKITATDIVKHIKNNERDFADLVENVFVRKGNLVVAEYYFYGQDRHLETLKKYWLDNNGPYSQYFQDEFGVRFELVSENIEDPIRSPKYKKRFGREGGIIEIELKVISN